MGIKKDLFNDKVVLITGGTGSFGKKFVKIVLEQYNPKAIRIYSRGELKQVEMEREFKDDRLRFFIGDVRDKERLSRAMNGVDVVIHAAALKHVPVCEYNPSEAVKTNINGAQNVIESAIDKNVEKVIALSTDKAVQPVNLYGATKLAAEKLFTQGNVYAGSKRTKFSCVRYGNVIGSRGSVIPLFKKQKSEGVVTVTDPRMTRFWVTLDKAVNLVLVAIEKMTGGEIFIPKIPSVKVTDLARVIAPNAEQKIIGIRPGEKLHEILITKEESGHTLDMGKYFIIVPEYPFWKRNGYTVEGGKLNEDYKYSSNNNDQWLSDGELKEILLKEGWV